MPEELLLLVKCEWVFCNIEVRYQSVVWQISHLKLCSSVCYRLTPQSQNIGAHFVLWFLFCIFSSDGRPGR